MADLSKHMESCSSGTKTFYLHYHNASCHRTWQDGDLSCGTPTNEVKWPFDHVALQNHLTY